MTPNIPYFTASHRKCATCCITDGALGMMVQARVEEHGPASPEWYRGSQKLSPDLVWEGIGCPKVNF